MSEPFIFIGTHTIKEGKLEDFKKSCGGLAGGGRGERAAPDRLQPLRQRRRTEVSVVQVHPDADSMLFHMQVAREHISEANESPGETREHRDLRKPNDTVLEMIRQLAGRGFR